MNFTKYELFPVLALKIDLTDTISKEMIAKVDHTKEHLTTKCELSNAYSTLGQINHILDVDTFEPLLQELTNTLLIGVRQEYDLAEYQITDSILVNIPKNGYLHPKKYFNSTFHIVVNVCHNDIQLILENPQFHTKTADFSANSANQYNSQFTSIALNSMEAIIIPSGMNYSFSDVSREITFIQVNVN